MNPLFARASVCIYIYIPVAVGGRADLVWDVDAAPGRETGHHAVVDASDVAGEGFKAIADCLAIEGGLGGFSDGLEPVAAQQGHGRLNGMGMINGRKNAGGEQEGHLLAC
ncbi:hypothetical protein SAY86_001368 [Trapa natans]|uniref:Uncharacterized protein n=1 Tax=Trapa natans TaxID=22666 RepID=A0AAN7RHJ6_TRANT|nr:hypothetical protein SAY86_001368 [Trapa natans]